MIDVETGYVYYTPVFYILAQFSKTIRPGDSAVQTQTTTDGLDEDALHACATINSDRILSVQVLNTTKKSLNYSLQISETYAGVTIPPNSLQTIRVQL